VSNYLWLFSQHLKRFKTQLINKLSNKADPS
jgi:hypothetical protein